VILTYVERQIPNTNNSAVTRVDVGEYFVSEMSTYVCHQHVSAMVWIGITVTHCPEITVIVVPNTFLDRFLNNFGGWGVFFIPELLTFNPMTNVLNSARFIKNHKGIVC
jgi:hypothetical protein